MWDTGQGRVLLGAVCRRTRVDSFRGHPGSSNFKFSCREAPSGLKLSVASGHAPEPEAEPLPELQQRMATRIIGYILRESDLRYIRKHLDTWMGRPETGALYVFLRDPDVALVKAQVFIRALAGLVASR